MTVSNGDAKTLRKRVPRTSFAHWKPAPDRRDPVQLLHETEAGRIPALLELRHERMRADPFGFYRGGAALMAADLAGHPVTGLRVQLGGDAHLLNYGGYSTPERNLIFDVNDFDETLPGPWEWDVARLCASAPLLAQVRGFSKGCGESAAHNAARAYRRHMRALATAFAARDLVFARRRARFACTRTNRAEDGRAREFPAGSRRHGPRRDRCVPAIAPTVRAHLARALSRRGVF